MQIAKWSLQNAKGGRRAAVGKVSFTYHSPNRPLVVGGMAHRFKRFQSRVECLGRTGPEALTYCIRMRLDALRLYAESRVMFKQPSQSIRNTDGG